MQLRQTDVGKVFHDAQTAVVPAAGDTLNQVKKLPQAERVADLGYDILCLTEDVDEFALRILESYQEKPFRSVSDPDLDLGTEEEKKEMEKRAEEAKPLLERIKTALGDKVLDVRLTDRLKNAAACLSGDEGMSVEMYKVLRQMPNGASIPMTFHLDLNPDHPVYAKLNGLDDEQLKEYAGLLLAQAKLVAGLPLDDPAAFAESICRLM